MKTTPTPRPHPDAPSPADPSPRLPRPALPDLLAAALTAAGLLLAATVDMAFLALAGLGTFGPGILRELGWLRDQDEFRRLAAWRAGYHASLAAGLAAVVLVAVEQRGTARIDQAMVPTALVLTVIWLAGLFSALLTYWGSRIAVSRLLLVFGSFWLAFAVLANLGDGMALLMQSLVVAPFFLLAWLSRLRPRLAGVLLVACAVVAFWFFGLAAALRDHGLSGSFTLVVFVGPLLAGGLALLSPGRRSATGTGD